MSFFKLKRSAFTLVELLVVIAIVGLLSTIVLISTSGLREQAEIAKALTWAESVDSLLGADAVGVWNFNEGSGITVGDISGWNNNGTLGNGVCTPGTGFWPAWTNDTPSGHDYALSFDGVDDRVKIPVSSNQGCVNGLTIEAWIYPTSVSAETIIDLGYQYQSYGFEFAVVGGKLRFTASGSGTFVSSDTTTLTVVNNVWQHVVVAVDDTGSHYYLNGVSESKSTPATPLTLGVNSTYFNIGYRNYNEWYFNGLIDEVHIYNQTLTAAQIESQYYAGLDRLLTKGLMDEQEYQERLLIRS